MTSTPPKQPRFPLSAHVFCCPKRVYRAGFHATPVFSPTLLPPLISGLLGPFFFFTLFLLHIDFDFGSYTYCLLLFPR